MELILFSGNLKSWFVLPLSIIHDTKKQEVRIDIFILFSGSKKLSISFLLCSRLQNFTCLTWHQWIEFRKRQTGLPTRSFYFHNVFQSLIIELHVFVNPTFAAIINLGGGRKCWKCLPTVGYQIPSLCSYINQHFSLLPTWFLKQKVTLCCSLDDVAYQGKKPGQTSLSIRKILDPRITQ